MPDNLSAAGISWKIYQNKLLGALNNTVIGYNGLINNFRQSANPSTWLARNGIAPTFPGNFLEDVRANALPAVSWAFPAGPSSRCLMLGVFAMVSPPGFR